MMMKQENGRGSRECGGGEVEVGRGRAVHRKEEKANKCVTMKHREEQ